MMSRYHHHPEEWSFTEPHKKAPASLEIALATPLRDLAGCWIQSECRGCRNAKGWPVRMLLTERRDRADLPLRRAVSSLIRCECCGRVGCRLALVSDPRWRESRAARKPPNWSIVASALGAELGTVAWTDPAAEYRPI